MNATNAANTAPASPPASGAPVAAIPDVSVVIPTFRRTPSFERAVRSVFAQTGLPPGVTVDLILADNDPAGSALGLARRLAQNAPAWLRRVEVLHEPSPGVANVRNTALASVTTPLVAFLDDDQSAPPGWLASFLTDYQRFPSAALFGRIETALPDRITRHVGYFRAFFDRTGPAMSGLIPYYYGCGNTLIDMRALPAQRPLFDTSANDTGGEDDLLFERVRAMGGRFAWSTQACVYEHVPDNRLTLAYTLRRAFAYGQGPSFKAHAAPLPRRLLLPVHMSVGAVQALLMGPVGGVLLLARLPGAAWCLDKAARGLGKLFWGDRFRQTFYGRAVLSQPTPSASAVEQPVKEPGV